MADVKQRFQELAVDTRPDTPEGFRKLVASEIAKWDTTIYHEELEPRDIKEGDPIPDGWTTEPGTLSVLWKNNSDGSYFKTKR